MIVFGIALVSGTTFLVGAAVFIWWKKYGFQSDFEYLKWSDIVVNYPVSVLGHTPTGEIVAAKYRSMPVALKVRVPYISRCVMLSHRFAVYGCSSCACA